MKKIVVSFLFCFSILIPVSAAAGRAAPAEFSDLNNHWAQKAIEQAVRQGVISGYPDHTMKPDQAVTRAEAAALISKVTKLMPSASTDLFPGLDGHWSKESVQKLAGIGMITQADYPNGFVPDEKITRFELMKWLSMGLAQSHPDFAQALADTKNTLLPTPEVYQGGIASSQIPYMALMKGTGIISGFEDGSFRPNASATRAEFISILLKYSEIEGTDPARYRDLNELREVGLTGTNITSLTPFRFSQVDYYDDKKRIKPSVRSAIEKFGIDTMDFMTYDSKSSQYVFDYDNAKKYMEIPDAALTMYSTLDGKIVDRQDIPADPSSIVRLTLEALDRQERILIGPRNPEKVTDEVYDLYRSNPGLTVVIDRDRVPYVKFTDVTEKPTKVGKLATITLHRMIVVDAKGKAGEKGKGVYANFFMDQIEPWMAGNYIVYSDFTFESHADRLDKLQLLNSPGSASGTSLFTLAGIDQKIADQKGIPTVPRQNFAKAAAKGEVLRFWMRSTFDDDYGPSFAVDSGERLRMYHSART